MDSHGIIAELNTDPDRPVVVYVKPMSKVCEITDYGYVVDAHAKVIVADIRPQDGPEVDPEAAVVDMDEAVKAWVEAREAEAEVFDQDAEEEATEEESDAEEEEAEV